MTNQNDTLKLNCLIKGESIVFVVPMGRNDVVSELKEVVQSERALDSLQGVGPHTLELWKPTGAIDAEPEATLAERIGPLGHDFSKFAVNLGSTRPIIDIFPRQPTRNHIHIIVKVPRRPTATISPSSSDSFINSGLRELYKQMWGKNRIVYRHETACSILDLAPFYALGVNARPDDILLVRDEYSLTYECILQDTLKKPTMGWWRSATLVTGQPGIGKTLFLYYVLARRLHEQGSVAFQINKKEFALFCQDGVSLHSTEKGSVPKGTWALSDSDSLDDPHNLCTAFRRPAAHVIHTSSPSSSHWKSWVKQLGARKYIMDVWSLKELQTLFALKNLNFTEGKNLFEKYGPSPRVVIDILTNIENTYEDEVTTAAAELAIKFSTNFPQLKKLDFGSDISSKIFTVKPQGSPWRYTLEIPTPFLCRTFGLAMSCQAAYEQHFFFRMLSSHPSFRDAGGWLFENYAHNCLSQLKRIPLKAYRRDGTLHHIPVPAKMIAGSTALKLIQPPHSFYWRPVKPNFKGVDAIIRSDNDVWALQYTISKKHKTATDGLVEIRDGMNHKTGVKWHLVMVGSDLTNATEAWDSQKLGSGWEKTDVYASELPLGQFNENHAEHLETILNNASTQQSFEFSSTLVYKQANDADLVPNQRLDSADPMDESL